MRRTIALVLVVVSHAGAIYWFHVSMRVKRAAPEQMHWRGELIFIAVVPNDRSDRLPAASTSKSERRDQIRNVAERVDPQSVQDDAPQTSDSDESIDWFAQGDQVANSIVARRNSAQALRSLDSKPTVIELPKEGALRREGTTQRFDDGEMITWISERCYVTNLPPAGPQLIEDRINVVCKNQRKPRDDLFDRFRPKYLGGPKKTKLDDELVDEDECLTHCN